MNARTCCLTLLVLLPLARPVGAQPPPLPPRGPSPLLFIRFSGPPGLRTTFYQGRPRGHAFDAPVVAGLRPGYLYRIEVGHLPGSPGVSFFPTLEVRGSLCLPPRLRAPAFPAPVVFTEADIASVLSGALVTKVVYLEDPDRAVPQPTAADRPLEIDLPPAAKLLDEARSRGRVMLVVRMGGRQLVSPEEMAQSSVYGTMLLPGERSLPPAVLPPCLLPDPRPFWDPLAGPRPMTEECLHDGGDRGLHAGLDPAGNLHGLDPEDTVAEFTDSHGRRGLTCSNRVCLCVPRFGVLRVEAPVLAHEAVVGVTDTRRVQGEQLVKVQVPSLQSNQFERLQAMRIRMRPSVDVGTEGVVRLDRIEVLDAQALALGPLVYIGTKAALALTEIERVELRRQVELARQLSTNVATQVAVGSVGTAVVGRIAAGPQIVTGEVTTRDLTVCCEDAVPCPPDKPLLLVKCADRTSAQPGDVVTFFLRYSNHGGQPITDVAVSDSLSPRLEYVPGTAQSDRPAVFTTEVNEAGSLILRWEITGTLQPGQSGALRFQARVR
jgi:uncharacterized repeat protein (TIGR01451 family)